MLQSIATGFAHLFKSEPNRDERGRFATKMYRGHGKGSSTTGTLTWVTPDKATAKGYADNRDEGVVSELDVELKNTFDLGRDTRKLTPSKFAVEVLAEAKAQGLVDDKTALALRSEFMKDQGKEEVAIHSLWAEEDGKTRVAKLLSGAGFDSVKLSEQGADTYGLLKKRDVVGFSHIFKANPHHDALGRFSSGSKAKFTSVSGVFAGRHSVSKATAAGLLKKSKPEKGAAERVMSTLSEKDRKDFENAISEVEGAIARGESTHLQHTEGGDGVAYTRERKKVHSKILSKLFEGSENFTPETPPPTVIVLGGRGGSGKSNFDKARNPDVGVYDGTKSLVLDSDRIKELLPGYDPQKAALVHEESSYILQRAIHRAKKKGMNVVLDITLGSDKTNTVKSFLKKGYNAEAAYMHKPPVDAAQSALERWNRPSKITDVNGVTREFKKSRLVPPEIVLSHTRNESNFDKIRGLVSRWTLVDHTVTGTFRRVAEDRNGRPV